MEKQKRLPKGKKRKPYSRDRDESAPRKPQNAYMRFMNEKREGVASQNPKLSVAEVTKMLGNQWTSLPHEDKKVGCDALLWKNDSDLGPWLCDDRLQSC